MQIKRNGKLLVSLLNREEVAQKIGVTINTVYVYIRKNDFPQPYKIGERCARWREDEIDEWIERKTKENPSSENEAFKIQLEGNRKQSIRLLKLQEVVQKTGLSSASVNRYIKTHGFPKQYKIGKKCARWREDEIDEWLESKTRKNQSNEMEESK